MAVRNANYSLGLVMLRIIVKPDAVIPAHVHKRVAEALFVVEGDFINEGKQHLVLRCISRSARNTVRTLPKWLQTTRPLDGWNSERGCRSQRFYHQARLYRKGPGKEAKLCFMGHALMENRNGLVVDTCLTPGDGHDERVAATPKTQPSGIALGPQHLPATVDIPRLAGQRRKSLRRYT